MFFPTRYIDSMFDDYKMNDLKCDIYEENNMYHIEMDIPGFSKEDINIEYDNGYLTISAHKEEISDKNYIRQERSYGKYQRSFYFGNLNIDDIKAKFENGILRITVPKTSEVETKKLIDIE